MIQRTFSLTENFTVGDMISQIREMKSYGSAAQRVMIMYEPYLRDVSPHVREIHEALPDMQIFGMTLLDSVGPGMLLSNHTVCSLFLLQSSSVDIRVMDCHQMTPEEAGHQYLEETRDLSDIRGILVMTANGSLLPSDFLDVVSGAYPGTPLFGAEAGAENLQTDTSIVFTEKGVYHEAILAAAFCGRDLSIYVRCNLGWKPLGMMHVVTGVKNDSIVETIDHRPAAYLYSNYLNIQRDDYFYVNACAFPLLEQTGKIMSARVPIHHYENGALRCSLKIKEGEKVCLSYSKPEYVLKDSLASANELAAFRPQAVLLYECLNRRIFLGDEKADREVSYFHQIRDSVCTGYGFGEIMKQGDSGGVLNSTMIVVGFREGPKENTEIAFSHDRELHEINRTMIPLNERLVTFLEQTTKELNQTISELEKLAVIDQLTGIANRRKIDEEISQLLDECRKGICVSVLMFDIDFFKKVNDTYGHLIGDSVLKELTSVVSGEIRETDLLGRWGGEEFVCLFDRMPMKDAMTVAERIRAEVDRHSFSGAGHITISIGVVEARPEDTSDTLFMRLDEALYRAKRNGRNRVEC